MVTADINVFFCTLKQTEQCFWRYKATAFTLYTKDAVLCLTTDILLLSESVK